MGELKNIIPEGKWDIFIETGTGIGTGLQFAQKQNFKKIYSFEVNKDLYYLAKPLEDSRTEIVHMSSPEGLDLLLPLISPKAKILFWLDAHYPGADFYYADYDSEKNEHVRLPLIGELNAIRKHRNGKDTILMDDLRIYMDDPDVIQELKPRVKTTVKDIENIMQDTHTFEIIYKDEKYGVFKPK